MPDFNFISFLSSGFGIGKALFGQRMNAALFSILLILGFSLHSQWKTGDPSSVTLLIALFAATAIAWLIAVLRPVNLIVNGRFRRRVEGWGTGYLEDEIRDGTLRHTNDAGRLPFRAYPSHQATHASGTHDTTQSRSHWWRSKSNSFRFSYREPRAPDKWGSLCQRIPGLRQNTPYKVRFFARGSSSDPKAFFFTGSLTWSPNFYISSSQDWTPYSVEFYADHVVDYAEIRFVIQGEGDFWITDVAVNVPFWKRRG